MSRDLREELNHNAMNTFQWFVISVCVLLNVIDGFDVLVMAFTATAVSNELKLSSSELGMLLSAGLFGMGFGSMFLAPLADKIGRRYLILICLIISGISMILASMTQTAFQLGAMRFITGLGIGGILASSNVIASEYASLRWRSLAVSLQSTGYAIGATVGGMVAIALIGNFGWRSVFLAGGLTTLGMLVLAFFVLPESLDYLVAKQPNNALNRINALTKKLGMTPIAHLPNQLDTVASPRSSLANIFVAGLGIQTLLLWFCFFFVMFGFYFVMSWTPKILASNGMTAEQGVTAGLLISAGGMVGAALIGLLSAKIRIFYVQAAFLLSTTLLILLFVNNLHHLTMALTVALLLGLTVNGCVAGLYAISPSLYNAEVRATGVGAAIGFGRIGGIVSPLIAGYFLDKGTSSLELYAYYGGIFALAMILVLLLGRAKATHIPTVAN